MPVSNKIALDAVGTPVSYDNVHETVYTSSGGRLRAAGIYPKVFSCCWLKTAERASEHMHLALSGRKSPFNLSGPLFYIVLGHADI